MKRTLFASIPFLVLMVFSLSGFTQVTFQKGYFIDNNGVKTECLIKDKDWDDNPTLFFYKLAENQKLEQKTIEEVTEFQVDGLKGIFKYLRHTVEIDLSSNTLDNLEQSSALKFQTKQLFLKVLVEGATDLLFYNTGNTYRFFYANEGETPKQLIYKRFLTKNDEIGLNQQYKQQLKINLSCPSLSKETASLSYSPKSMIDYFNKYNNNCKNTPSISYQPIKNKPQFNLSVRPGFNYSSLANPIINPSPTTLAPRIGLELEFIAPFNNNKWSALLEPTFQYLSSKSELGPNETYRSLEIQIGIRHYIFLNEDSKLFLNTLFGLDARSDTYNFYYGNEIKEIGIKKYHTNNKFAFGGGYMFKEFGLEIRHQRSILGVYGHKNSKYRSYCLILSYKIL